MQFGAHIHKTGYFIDDANLLVCICVCIWMCLHSLVYKENLCLHLGCLASNYYRFVLLVFILKICASSGRMKSFLLLRISSLRNIIPANILNNCCHPWSCCQELPERMSYIFVCVRTPERKCCYWIMGKGHSFEILIFCMAQKIQEFSEDYHSHPQQGTQEYYNYAPGSWNARCLTQVLKSNHHFPAGKTEWRIPSGSDWKTTLKSFEFRCIFFLTYDAHVSY